MKSILKNILAGILGWQVRRLRARNNFKIVGVVGSIGKTSTKLAIAEVLEAGKRVRYQEGNYNEIISVPLIFFGHRMPPIWNVFEWAKIILLNEFQIWGNYPFDVVVVELGTDAPGQINEFRKYLHLDIAVVTAIAPEHMEFFESLREVAEEEWSVSYFSDIVFANRDLCQIIPSNINLNQIVFYDKNFDPIYKYEAVSPVQLYSISIAVILAKKFKISDDKIIKAVSKIKSFAGRMQKLRGIKKSIIIDDTYNASPDAVKMALDTLYSFESSQRIAILGMMNELGSISKEEHEKIGRYCNPKFLDLVVTVGRDANAYIAPAARDRGCIVYEAKNSIDAGRFVAEEIRGKAVILAKGSQNGVFTEEALKPLLANKSDIPKLVRQDKYWMNRKQLTFG